MQVLSVFNLNSILMMLIGIGCLIGGILLYKPQTRTLAAGLFFLGIGNVILGVTHGFSDQTLTGRILFRIAIITYAVATPVFLYAVFASLQAAASESP